MFEPNMYCHNSNGDMLQMSGNSSATFKTGLDFEGIPGSKFTLFLQWGVAFFTFFALFALFAGGGAVSSSSSELSSLPGSTSNSPAGSKVSLPSRPSSSKCSTSLSTAVSPDSGGRTMTLAGSPEPELVACSQASTRVTKRRLCLLGWRER